MSEPLAAFDHPPVVETVMSVQFAPLPNFSSPYAGWYWNQCLDEDWVKTEQASPLLDQFERFGSAANWTPVGAKFVVQSGIEPVRVQIVRRDEERMIQLQHNRFIYNWRKRGDTYPSYEILRPEFDDQFEQFSRFVKDAGLGELEPNQWEMTYVNHIESGTLWQAPTDWSNVLPGFYAPARGVSGQQFESFGGEWHLVVAPNRGRLHVNVRHGRVGKPDGPEALVVQLTARGPIDESKGWTLHTGFELGHKVIVRSFLALTSKTAQEHWGRRS
ncbi:MAG: TIGR04255 family protein [Acidimicrobiia bacterium]